MLWKGFQKPKRLEVDRDSQTDQYGRFFAQPFESCSVGPGPDDFDGLVERHPCRLAVFFGIGCDIDSPGQAIKPLVLDIFGYAGCVLVPPARIDRKRPAGTGVDQAAFVSQAGLLGQFAACRFGMRLTGVERSGDRLPEIEGGYPPQQQNVAVVGVDNDEY